MTTYVAPRPVDVRALPVPLLFFCFIFLRDREGLGISVSDWAGSVSDWRHALEGLKGVIAPAFERV